MISLCMIVKNEEQNLSNCLKNIKSQVDEIVIVDTGSIDKTVEIAKQYTDKVFNFKWCDDFAAARNYSIEKAKNDWILVLDADESVEFFNKEALDKLINFNEKQLGRIKIINTLEDAGGKKQLTEKVSRIFNKKYFRYYGMIHEQIVPINEEDYKILDADIVVNHIGYEKDVVNSKGKIVRNKELLQKAILENPKDSYLYYQLGKTFFMAKDYEKAEMNFENALKLGANEKYEYAEDLIESYGYTLINLKKYKEALALEKYEAVYKNIADFNFVMALIYMNNAKFKEAVMKFEQCKVSAECKIEGANSYLADYNIGVIYECLGFVDEAVKHYKACKNYSLALNRLKLLHKL